MKKNYMQTENKLSLELFFSKKYILLLAALLLLVSGSSSAQTAGPNYPATGNFIAGANIDWNNSGNITADDTAYTTLTLSSGQNSDYLQGTNYGFSIPTGVVINGITVSIMRQSNSISSSRSIQDVVVRLVKNGTIVGNNYGATATIWPATMTAANYGGTTDLWGTTWTAADINNANFGVVLSVNSPTATRTASVDYIRVTVSYTPAPTISNFSPTSACVDSSQSVVITGNYFNGASAVSFNGVTASFTVNSNTQITATLPIGATTGAIEVTTPSGMVTSASNFTVNPLPVLAAITGTSSVCIGSTITLANSTSGGTWSSASPSVATINPTTGMVTGVTSGTSLITYTYTNGNGCTNSINTTVTVDALPVVSAPSSVCLGDTAQLTPNSGGTWISNDTSKATVDNLTGEVIGVALGNTTFTFTNTTTGCSATTTALNILVSPAITAHPAVTQTVCSGSSVSFSVTATGAGLTYQWFNGATQINNGGSVSGATSATLTINPTTNADASASYNCVVSGTCAPSVTSNNATLVVDTLSIGGAATITHTANSSGVLVPLASPTSTYTDCHLSDGIIELNGQSGTVIRWESSTDAGNTWLNLGGAGISTFNYTEATATTIFRAVVRNGSCNITYSSSAILFIIPNIKPRPVSASPSTICIGESTTLTSLSGFSSSQNIQYGGLFNNANPEGWSVDGNGIFSASADNGFPTFFKETNGNASDEYDTTSNDKFAIARGNLDSTLQTPVFDLFGLASANLTFDHAHKLVPGAWGKVELSFNGGTTYPVTLATYTGNQGPYNQFNTGVSINLNAYLGYTNLRIRFNYHGLQAKAPGIDGDAWVIDNVEIPQAPVPALTSLWTDITNSNAIVSVTNATNVTVYPTVTTTYAVTSFLNGCTSYGPEGTTYVTVTVNQLPIVTASPPTICSGDVSSIPLSSAVVGTQTSTTFAWTVAQTDATGGSDGSGSAINQTLTATGMVQGVVTYTITPTANGCIGPVRTIEARVNPRPKADIQPSQTICYGGTATFSVALEGTGPWNLTYSNGVATTTVNGITTSPYIFSVSGMTVNRTFTITALSDSRCSATSQNLTGAAVVTVLNGTPGLWTGLVSTDWFDCKNWAGGLPSSTIDAQIPTTTVAGRMPVIDRTSPFAAAYSFIATARDLLIANSASVTMVATNNSELQISRDWKNSGVFTPGTGTVTFVGATLNQIHAINIGIKTNEGFYNLTTNTSNNAKGISVVDGFELTVSNELSLLSGDLRLTGGAQLVQNGTVANPSAGTGKILIDQQGLKSSYHYNYWSSPVTTSGTNYTVGNVLKDGTDSAANPFSPSEINFADDYYFADGALTSPIKISTSWIYKYTSISTVYAGWQHVGSSGTIDQGEGFTMKGTTGVAPFTTPQNYVFAGKPNNGNINLSIALDQSYLVGNPYPSALDADEFIKDNIKDGAGRATSNVFNGALYFWDHFGGQSHILNEYIGGYATYTLMGGVVAVSNDPLINADGSFGSRSPKRHIPVGQGFFIGTGSNAALTTNNPALSTPITGGTVAFKNSQRAFKTESAVNSVFFRNSSGSQTENTENDVRQKIRLQYISPSNMNRQILVGVDELTTNLYDIGYDAAITDLNTEDMYWNNSNAKLVIQAVPDFNQEQIIPIGLKTAVEGLSTIKIAGLENIAESTEIYIHDNETGIDHNIRTSDFAIALPIGEYNDRFSLRFSAQALGVNNPTEISPIIYFTNNDSSLNIKNTDLNFTVKSVALFNLLGQLITTYNLDNSDQQNIKIPVLNISKGTYIVKIMADNNRTFSQKIIKN